MSFQIIYPFDSPLDYNYNATKITDPDGAVMLKRQPATRIFEELFDSDTGFTFNPTNAEITGGKLQQKDTRPADATLYASFTINEDSNWGGNLNNVLVNGAVVDSGKIDLTGATGKILNMPALGNFDALAGDGAKGCIRFTYIPNYNGAPSVAGHILELDTPAGNNNAIFIRHYGPSPPDYVSIDLRDSSGTSHFMYTASKSFIQGQKYIFELNFDFTGVSRFFIDGVLEASLNTSSWTRTNDVGTFKWGGDSGTGDFWLDDVVLFDDVQHMTNHSDELPFSYNPTIFIKGIIENPKFTHVGLGFITSLDGFAPTETGSLLYNLKTGTENWKWYNGSSWADANGTDSEANTKADMNSNISSFTSVYGGVDVFVKIFFTNNSNTQSSVSTLAVNCTGLEGYATDNPKIIPVASVLSDGIISIAGTTVEAGSDSITYTVSVGGVEKYFDGVEWKDSSGYPQTNTEVGINNNASSLLIPLGVELVIVPYLHTGDGSTTPSISNLILEYNSHGILPSAPGQCLVYGYVYDNKGTAVPNVTVSISLTEVDVYNNEILIAKNIQEKTTDSTGYWEASLVENTNMSGRVGYEFKFSGSHTNVIYNKIVPDTATENFIGLDEL